jgi:hypothetical protein
MYAVQLNPDDWGPAQLTLAGTISADGGVFGLGFALCRTATAQPVEDGDLKWLAVDLLGADKAIRSTTLVPALPICAFPDPDSKPSEQVAFLIDSLIPLVDDVQAMVVRDEDRVYLHRIFVSDPPVIDALSAKSQGGDAYVVSWSAYHPAGVDVEHIVMVSQDDGATWRPTTLPIGETSIAVNVAPASGVKTLLFGVVTTDGLNTVFVRAEPVEAMPVPPQLGILTPGPGTVRSPLTLIAITTEPSQLPSIRTRWTSSTDGEIAQGMSTVGALSPGKHTISVSLVDDSGKPVASDSVAVVVE